MSSCFYAAILKLRCDLRGYALLLALMLMLMLMRVCSPSIDLRSQGQGLCLSYLHAYLIMCGQTASVVMKAKMAILEPKWWLIAASCTYFLCCV